MVAAPPQARLALDRPAHNSMGVDEIDTEMSQNDGKIHDFSLIWYANRSNLMENDGISRFPKNSWEIWVSIASTRQVLCRPRLGGPGPRKLQGVREVLPGGNAWDCPPYEARAYPPSLDESDFPVPGSAVGERA